MAGESIRNDRTSGRLIGLDALRGLTIAAMILVNNPGSWSDIYWPLRHAEWHGCTPTDLIFPFFLFMVGAACAFSLRKYAAGGRPTARLWIRTGRRVAVLFALGLVLNGFPAYNLETIRIPGVLQRIALVYALLVPVVVLLSLKWQTVIAAGALVVYWALLAFAPVPGTGVASLAPGSNWVLRLDEMVLGRAHMWAGAETDPEGLLSTLPAVATALIGYWAGLLVRDGRRLGRVALLGSLLAPAGLLLALHQPLNKPLWTPSYVLFTGGLACWALAACVWAWDVRGWKRAAEPAVVFGVNAIFVFVASGLVARLLGMGDPSIKSRVYGVAFESWLDGANASLAYALVYVAMWWGVLVVMKRFGLVIRV